MSVVTPDVVDDALLQGTQEAISFCLGEIPVVGSFLSLIFGHVWDMALSGRTAEKQQEAMNSLFGSIQKMIDKTLAENIADQARAYNASIAEQGQDYRTSVDAFKESGGSDTEITALHNDINARLTSAYNQTIYDAAKKLVTESGEFYYPNMGSIGMSLSKLVGGLMSFQTEWHDGKNCLLAPAHPDYFDTDQVDNQAYYQLRLHRNDSDKKYYYAMPQVFFGDGRAAYHVYTGVDTQIKWARFAAKDDMSVRLRVYYLVDMDDYDSSDILVTLKNSRDITVHEFHTNKRYRSILSVPWVKLYSSDSSEGSAWSTDWDKFSSNFRFYYDDYDVFDAQQDLSYNIYTSAGSSATKNYYIIGFEVAPVNGVPDALESTLNTA